jgi:nucleoredoxin
VQLGERTLAVETYAQSWFFSWGDLGGTVTPDRPTIMTSTFRVFRIIGLCLLCAAICCSKENDTVVAEVSVEGDVKPLQADRNASTIVENGTMPTKPDNITTNPSTTTRTEKSQADERGTLSKSSSEPLPLQSGPLIDLFGSRLFKLAMVDSTTAELRPNLTSDALRGKKVIGVYFSADWCGPCRQFTPELVSFYKRMNQRRGQKDQFEIVWVSRCRDVDSYGKFFAHMGGWVALPPEEAMGNRGTMLSTKFKVKGIPTLVLLDDLGEVITLDGRNKIPQDKAGIGFPWRNPLANVYIALVPRSLRLMIRSHIQSVKENLFGRLNLAGRLAKNPRAVKS